MVQDPDDIQMLAPDDDEASEASPPAAKPYEPLFVEETWIVRMYGTNEQNERFDLLMQTGDDRWTRIEIVLLVEHIKEHHRLGLMTRCCPSCPHYETCRLNWRRGELDLPRTCCSNCPTYTRCSRKLRAVRTRPGSGRPAATPEPEPLLADDE